MVAINATGARRPHAKSRASPNSLLISLRICFPNKKLEPPAATLSRDEAGSRAPDSSQIRTHELEAIQGLKRNG
jgi:hypothetical protein